MPEILNTKPTFSIIVPTWGDPEALGRTLVNLIFQRDANDILRDILVCGDGYEEQAREACTHANDMAQKMGQAAKVFYLHLKGHSGGGNLPRRAGIKAAKQQWLLFIDAGTSVCHDAFRNLALAVTTVPEAKIITWDMVQLLDPVPIVTSCHAVHKLDRSKGLPYVLPGCATAVLRDAVLDVEWPDVDASDWAYFSKVWEKIFGLPEDTQRAEDEVVLLPVVMTIAYGARTVRRERSPITTKEEYDKLGYSIGWQTAVSEVEMPTEIESANGTI